MGKATEKQIEFAEVIAEELGLEDELEVILDEKDSFPSVSQFIEENTDEFYQSKRSKN